MPFDAPIKALVKIDRDAENNDSHCRACYKEPPAYQQIGQDTQERAAKENAHARPTEAITVAIQKVQTTLQSLNLPLYGF